jgi:hypothetical protein
MSQARMIQSLFISVVTRGDDSACAGMLLLTFCWGEDRPRELAARRNRSALDRAASVVTTA